jgi:peroxiredoxin
MTKEQGITFPVLSDKEFKVIDAYGLRHKGASVKGTDIARPAIFIIDASGKIKWRFLTDNWRVRARAEDILRELLRPSQ